MAKTTSAKSKPRVKSGETRKGMNRHLKDVITSINNRFEKFKKAEMANKPITPEVMNKAIDLMDSIIRSESKRVGIVGVPTPKILKIPIREEDAEACGYCFIGYSPTDIVFCIDGLLDKIKTKLEKNAAKESK